ncbi:MAG: hypothetical protein H0T45_05070 [Pyrinomonadaceae bacterium]|nr:hypothetical protein [Pyrinomonadaceae bacterium]
MLTRNKLFPLICLLALPGCVTLAQERMVMLSRAMSAQKSEEIVRVNTHVVFIDTLVRDQKTGAPVRDLSSENFQVLADGRPRTLSYFSREGLSRRPLALVLVLDLYTSGILFLEKPEVMEHIISALAKLQPEDEVAVMQTWYEPEATPLSFQVKSRMVEGLTRDRAKTFAALRSVQQFAKQNLPQVKIFFSLKDAIKATWKDEILVGMKGAAGSMPTDPPVKTTVAPDFEYMIDQAPLLATRERPDSQVVIVEVTDDFGAERLGKTAETARKLIASNVTVSGLVMEKDLMGKAVEVIGHLTTPLFGQRFHTISYYGKQTGGEVATVGRPEEFAAAIDSIIDGLAARYSLGFTLGEGERNDNRMHKLEVKVKARDVHGRERKLAVSARRGYFTKADQ